VTHAFADPLTQRLAEFIRGIGLGVEPATLGGESLLPGVTVKAGSLLVDQATLLHRGDLLHEAGHLAVCEPARRATLEDVGDDPAEEMAAIAWSYAAARHLEIDPTMVFHSEGYRGGAQVLLTAFESGATVGQPMLEWFGMTLSPKAAAEQGLEPYPHMLRWLR
jgi:hypothetical protein